jgi:glutathione S-transferase
MIRLYGGLASPYVARCVMALRLKSVEHELAPPPGGQKSQEFQALSPFGKVPVLREGNFSLTESEVICEYIEDKYPDPPLLPRDAAERAQSRLISRITDLYLLPAIFALSRQIGAEPRDQSAIDQRAEDLIRTIDVVEQQITSNPWALGPEPLLADCALVTAFTHLMRIATHMSGDLFGARQKLSRYRTFIQGNEETARLLFEAKHAWEEFMKRRIEATQP